MQTQFVFDLGIFERFLADVRDLGIDHKGGVMAGVGPVQSLRVLECMQICVGITQRIHRELGTFPANKLIINRDCGLRHLPAHVARSKLSAMVKGTVAVRRTLPEPTVEQGA